MAERGKDIVRATKRFAGLSVAEAKTTPTSEDQAAEGQRVQAAELEGGGPSR